MSHQKVMAEQCGSCIFGPNSPVSKARFADLSRQWKRHDTHQICHLAGVGEGGYEPLDGEDIVCRGFYDNVFLKRGTGQLLRIMERLNGIEFVAVPNA